jgi:DNA mismatch repair protein MutH
MKRPFSRRYANAPTTRPPLDEEAADRDLHEDLEALMDAVVLQGADHLEARAIADVR